MNFDEIFAQTKIEEKFPKLKNNCSYTSKRDPKYNCIAWAAGDDKHWWEPNNYWPSERKEYTIEAYEEVYLNQGFKRTTLDDLSVENGVLKIALFVKKSTIFRFHAARQLASGKWASKLGKSFDIEHNLRDLEGEEYGEIERIFKKEIR